MYYLELIDRFWEFNKVNNLGPTAISFYLYLLKIGNENDRYDFKISDSYLCKHLGISRPTIKITREKLARFELINYERNNGIACYYRLLLNYPVYIINEPTKEYDTTQKIRIEALSENDDKVINNNNTIQSKPAEKKTELTAQQSDHIPTIDEFMDFAKTLECYDSNIETEIKLKYENWSNNDWKNSYDRPITNWKSTLKSTIPFLREYLQGKSAFPEKIPQINRPKSKINNN